MADCIFQKLLQLYRPSHTLFCKVTLPHKFPLHIPTRGGSSFPSPRIRAGPWTALSNRTGQGDAVLSGNLHFLPPGGQQPQKQPHPLRPSHYEKIELHKRLWQTRCHMDRRGVEEKQDTRHVNGKVTLEPGPLAPAAETNRPTEPFLHPSPTKQEKMAISIH